MARTLANLADLYQDYTRHQLLQLLAEQEARAEESSNRLSLKLGLLNGLARSFRDTLCRVLDTAERRTKVGKPLEQDEIDAMTARLVEDTEKLNGLGRRVPPHSSGGGQPMKFTREDGPEADFFAALNSPLTKGGV